MRLCRPLREWLQGTTIFFLQNLHCTMGDSECTYHWNHKPIDPPFEALLGFRSELSIALGSQQEARSLVSVRWNIEFPIDSGIVVISCLDVGHRDLFVVHGLRHISIDATMTRTTITREEKENSQLDMEEGGRVAQDLYPTPWRSRDGKR
jgi:hypothetical protein